MSRPNPKLRTGLGAVLSVLLLSTSSVLRADFLSRFFAPHDVDVMMVTDMTEAGRAYAPATREKPVRYMIIDFGEGHFGKNWAGEKLPPDLTVRRWMMKAIAQQGYLLADEQHPPEQLFIFSWGMLQGDPLTRPALRFLGGEKVNLMWEQEPQYGGFVSPMVHLRTFNRMGVAGKVWDFAATDLFLGVLRSYTMDSLRKDVKPTLLWETRFATPSAGVGFMEAMPLMIKSAALHVGRETTQPVTLLASDVFRGSVTFGEFKILGEDTPPPVTTGESPKPATEKPPEPDLK